MAAHVWRNAGLRAAAIALACSLMFIPARCEALRCWQLVKTAKAYQDVVCPAGYAACGTYVVQCGNSSTSPWQNNCAQVGHGVPPASTCVHSIPPCHNLHASVTLVSMKTQRPHADDSGASGDTGLLCHACRLRCCRQLLQWNPCHLLLHQHQLQPPRCVISASYICAP